MQKASSLCDSCKLRNQEKDFIQFCSHFICKECIKEVFSTLKIENQINKQKRPVNYFRCPIKECQQGTNLDKYNYELAQKIWSEGQMCESLYQYAEEEQKEQQEIEVTQLDINDSWDQREEYKSQIKAKEESKANQNVSKQVQPPKNMEISRIQGKIEEEELLQGDNEYDRIKEIQEQDNLILSLSSRKSYEDEDQSDHSILQIIQRKD